MCFFSLLRSPAQEAQLVSRRDLTAHVCKGKSQAKHSPETYTSVQGEMMGSVCPQQTSSCLWKPWNGAPLEENAKLFLSSSFSWKQGSRQLFNSMLGFLLWPRCPICCWALQDFVVVVPKWKAAIRQMGWASGVPQSLKKSPILYDIWRSVWVLRSPGLSQTSETLISAREVLRSHFLAHHHSLSQTKPTSTYITLR